MIASDSADGKHMLPPYVNSSFCFKLRIEKGVCTDSVVVGAH
jgi:hypothetical protein